MKIRGYFYKNLYQFSHARNLTNLHKVVFGTLALSATAHVFSNNSPSIDRNGISDNHRNVKEIDKDFSEKQKKVKELKNKWKKETLPNNPKEAATCIYKRGEELKKVFSDEYFVFVQAQSPALTPLVYFINFYAQKIGFNKTPFFKHLRFPEELPQDLINECIDASKNGNDCHNLVRKIILSADIYFPHRTFSQSAFHYLENKRSVFTHNKEDTISRIVFSFLSSHSNLDPKLSSEIGKKLEILGKNLENKAVCGNLWIICIPKSLLINSSISKFMYRSHLRGYECPCKENEIEILEKLQNNILDKTTQCTISTNLFPHSFTDSAYFYDPAPQYRLNIRELTDKNGVLTFMLTPFTKEQRKEVKQQSEIPTHIQNKLPLSSAV